LERQGEPKRSRNLYSSKSMLIAFTLCCPSLLGSLYYQAFPTGIQCSLSSPSAALLYWALSATRLSLQVYNAHCLYPLLTSSTGLSLLLGLPNKYTMLIAFTFCCPSQLGSLYYQAFLTGI